MYCIDMTQFLVIVIASNSVSLNIWQHFSIAPRAYDGSLNTLVATFLYQSLTPDLLSDN